MGAAPPRKVPKLLDWVVSAHGRHIHDISTRGCFVSDDAIASIGGNCPNLEVLIADEFVQEQHSHHPPTIAVPAGSAVKAAETVGSGSASEAASAEGDTERAEMGDALQLVKRAVADTSSIGSSSAGSSTAPSGADQPGPPVVRASVSDRSAPRVTDRGLSALSACPHLTRLDASRCQITDAGLEALGASHSFLSYVKVSSPLVTHRGIDALVQSCRDLLALDVGGCNLGDEAVALIGRSCPRLRMLNADGCVRISDAGVQELSRSCRDMRILVLSRCPRLTDDSLTQIAQHLEYLHRLDVSYALGITDEGLEEIAECCEDLESIAVQYCPSVTGDGVAALLSDCPHLRQLQCEGIRVENVVEEVQPQCTSLTSLQFRQCGALSDASLAAISQGCPNLTSLDISHGPLRGFAHLALGAMFVRLRGLRALDLSYTGISDESLCTLAYRSPRLIRLSLAGNPSVTNDGVGSVMLGTGRSMLDLSLQGCSITSAALGVLATYSQNLTRLDVSGCEGLTDEGFEVLARGCTRLEVLIAGVATLKNHQQVEYRVARAIDAPPSAARSEPGVMPTHGADELLAGGADAAAATKRRGRRRRGGGKKKAAASGSGSGGATTNGPKAGGQEPGKKKGGAGKGGAPKSNGKPAAAQQPSKKKGGKGGKKRSRPETVPYGDAAVGWIVRHCTRLHSLHIPGLAGLTDAGLQQIASGPSSGRLVQLVIAGCPQVTDAGLMTVAKSCKQVSFLGAAHLPLVTDAGLVAAIRAARSRDPNFRVEASLPLGLPEAAMEDFMSGKGDAPASVQAVVQSGAASGGAAAEASAVAEAESKEGKAVVQEKAVGGAVGGKKGKGGGRKGKSKK